MRAKDVTGQRFGRLTALARFSVDGISYWRCCCDCGQETTVRYLNLGRVTRSCGCLKRDACRGRERKKNHPTHGAMLSYYKRNAKVRQLSWDLTEAEFTSLITAPCHYCGSMPSPHLHRGRTVLFNGIDRLDNAVGYVSNNCVAACTICNRAKLDLPLDEFLAWTQRLTSHTRVSPCHARSTPPTSTSTTHA